MTKPRLFAICASSFRGRARRLRIEGVRGSVGRETRGVGYGTTEMMRATGVAVGMGGGVADRIASGAEQAVKPHH